jgi:FlaA1/EpsC-like NDP-sugar epimerase
MSRTARRRWPERLLSLRNRYLVLADLITLPLAAYLAFVLRLEPAGHGLGSHANAALIYVLLSPALKIPTMLLFGGYSRYWPFASLPELQLIAAGAAAGELACMAIALLLEATLDVGRVPRSVPVIAVFLTATALALPRLGLRLLNNRVNRHAGKVQPTRRVLIVGAGESGNLVLREIRRNPQMGLDVVGFIDDDPVKQRLHIQEVRILGRVAEIPQLVKEYRVQRVLIAIPTATGDEMRHIVDVCQEAKVEALTLPGVFELISGRVEVQRFRPVQVEDLLAREPVQTDISQIEALLAGKTVLITGAGGSIGSELCRQIARCAPGRLILVGHGENSIYQIHRELGATHPKLDLAPVIADTRDAARIDALFARLRPDVVVHAAAHKHVPLMEWNPEEAVTNNVGGTRNLIRACERTGVGTFVLISTDKAVNPTSTMGATKRIAEHLVQEAAQRTGRRFVAVRFGNVLGSRGSVVPLFQQQIEAGGPVTVTDAEMTRYFMTIPEAVQLVLQAAALGEGGEVFVLDMGEPVKIVDLARDMIRLAGLREGEDIHITYTGLRPGEKLFEEIFLDEEHHSRTVHEKIFASRNGHLRAGTPQADAWCADLPGCIDALLEAAACGDTPRLFRLMRTLIPECADTLGAAACEERPGD